MKDILKFLGHEYSISGLAGACIMIGFIILAISSILFVSKIGKKAGVEGFSLFSYKVLKEDAEKVKLINTKAKKFRLERLGMILGYSFIVLEIFLNLPHR